MTTFKNNIKPYSDPNSNPNFDPNCNPNPGSYGMLMHIILYLFRIISMCAIAAINDIILLGLGLGLEVSLRWKIKEQM
jgi:hypothetical protein